MLVTAIVCLSLTAGTEQCQSVTLQSPASSLADCYASASAVVSGWTDRAGGNWRLDSWTCRAAN